MRRLGVGLILLMLAAFSAPAVDWKALKPQGSVSDFAGVVDPGSRRALEDYAARVEKATGAQMAFVTLPTLEGEPIEDVASDLFHSWAIGQKNADKGILFLLVVQDRRSQIEAGQGVEQILPDDFHGMLLEDMRPELRAGHYGHAMVTAAQAIGDVLAKAKNVKLAPPGQVAEAPRPIYTHHLVPWVPILFGLVIFWVLLRAHARGAMGGGGGGFWTGLLLGNLLSHAPFGGRGGGAFGGYDSGGSAGGFGGFGGGGGRARSDW